jgi:hypothetical protein
MQGFLKEGKTYRTLNDVQYIDETDKPGILISFYDETYEEYEFTTTEARDKAITSLFKAMGCPIIEFEHA